jgi:hypothetical protein
MGRVVARRAGVDRIASTIKEANVRATAHGGDVAAAAAARLTSPLAAIATALLARGPAKDALQVARAALRVAVEAGRTVLGTIHDLVWNGLGRPASHEALLALFPDGVSTYFEAPPKQLPVLLQLFASRFAEVAAPPWTPAQVTQWLAQVDAARTALIAALAAETEAAAVNRLAASVYASKVRAGLRALVVLKRDLKTLGLAEAQVTEIIPDATPRPATGGASPPPAPAPVPTVPPALPPATVVAPDPSVP